MIDLSALAGLTNLTELWLESNQIVDISPLPGLTNLTWLRLPGNQISDIIALVHNAGFAVGDSIDIRHNHLDLRPGSLDMADIEALQGRGVDVDFDPQN